MYELLSRIAGSTQDMQQGTYQRTRSWIRGTRRAGSLASHDRDRPARRL